MILNKCTKLLLIITIELSNILNTIGHNFDAFHGNSFDDSIYYKINWHRKELNYIKSDVKSISDESSGDSSRNDPKFIVSDDTSLWITTVDRERYHCVLPKVESYTSEFGSSSKTLGNELSPYQLLKPLFEREVCSYRLESYWTYEICHGKFIRQFHEESSVKKSQNGPTQEYTLGKYDISQLSVNEAAFDKTLEQLEKDGHKRPTVTVEDIQLPYIEINMTGGTLCDLKNTPRFTRVLYVCNEDAKNELYSIKETSTCEYEAIVLSPLLCSNPDFKITMAPERDINCYAIGKSPMKPKALRKLENDAKKQRLENLKKKKESLFPGLFDGKTIIIGASEFGKELRINIIPEEPEDKSNSVNNAHPRFDPEVLRTFLSGDLCLHGGTGWWKYEFCYGKKVEQYHEEKGVKKTVITLGKWNKDEHIKWIEKNPMRKPKPGKTPRNVSHFYSNGDLCDVTAKTRQVEVKLKCRHVEGHPDSVAIYLLEPKTCEYILGIESPIICHLLSTVDESGFMYHPDARAAEEALTQD